MNLRMLLPTVFSLALVLEPAAGQASKQIKLAFDLDKIVSASSVWEMTPEKLEELCKEPGFKEPPQFKWLTQSHEGAKRPFFTLLLRDLA